jgi:ABC-2 type transport system ATP-binding protein
LDDKSTNVIEIRHLSRQFGKYTALKDVNIVVPSGCVFGLIGENGAGKTTLIRHIMGLLRAQSGTVRVFGRDPVADPVAVLGRIGYLSEDGDLPSWMRIDELMRYTQAFYPGWDEAYANDLRRDFALELDMVVKNLSRGQRARAGLLVALAHRPDLLVFDEPSSGLDPIVRRDILGAIIRTVADDGRTVLFSSHLLGEVERVADHVAMVKDGKIVFDQSLESIKDAYYKATFRFDKPLTTPPNVGGILRWDGTGREWSAICAGSTADAVALEISLKAKIVEQCVATLDEIFVAYSGETASRY